MKGTLLYGSWWCHLILHILPRVFELESWSFEVWGCEVIGELGWFASRLVLLLLNTIRCSEVTNDFDRGLTKHLAFPLWFLRAFLYFLWVTYWHLWYIVQDIVSPRTVCDCGFISSCPFILALHSRGDCFRVSRRGSEIAEIRSGSWVVRHYFFITVVRSLKLVAWENRSCTHLVFQKAA